MLNYGYAILYSRVWQALLNAQLNPYDSIIHVRQRGKPTFVYDVVEIFRAQAVDRVVFSLIQKKEPVEVKDGMLTADIAKLVDAKTDQVAYYTLCMDCFTNILYQPERKRKESISSTTVV